MKGRIFARKKKLSGKINVLCVLCILCSCVLHAISSEAWIVYLGREAKRYCVHHIYVLNLKSNMAVRCHFVHFIKVFLKFGSFTSMV